MARHWARRWKPDIGLYTNITTDPLDGRNSGPTRRRQLKWPFLKPWCSPT
ncbi:hypothetical protein O9992_27650 [Vibrio lentus]|nr:hypothetical protein [Vibrio lentus]